MSLLLVGLQNTFSDLSYVSGLEILSSYFISLIVWSNQCFFNLEQILDKSVLMSF